MPPRRGKKKADVAEHPEGFDHVGILFNQPPGTAGLPFNESSEIPFSDPMEPTSSRHRPREVMVSVGSGRSKSVFVLRLNIPRPLLVTWHADDSRSSTVCQLYFARPEMRRFHV